MAMRELPRNFHSDEYGGVSAPAGWVLMPAYTILPFIRSPLGIHLVHPWTVIRRTLLLIVVPTIIEAVASAFSPPHPRKDLGLLPLDVFALAYCALSLAIFARRWRGQRSGDDMHSAESGYSILVRITSLPVWLIEQLVVPVATLGLGYLIAQTISVEFGWWLMVAGLSVFIMARWEHRCLWAQHQATVDDFIRAGSYEDRIARHDNQHAGAANAGADAPVFADLGDDVARPRNGVGR
jgi:hypothetical protein